MLKFEETKESDSESDSEDVEEEDEEEAENKEPIMSTAVIQHIGTVNRIKVC